MLCALVRIAWTLVVCLAKLKNTFTFSSHFAQVSTLPPRDVRGDSPLQCQFALLVFSDGVVQSLLDFGELLIVWPTKGSTLNFWRNGCWLDLRETRGKEDFWRKECFRSLWSWLGSAFGITHHPWVALFPWVHLGVILGLTVYTGPGKPG